MASRKPVVHAVDHRGTPRRGAIDPVGRDWVYVTYAGDVRTDDSGNALASEDSPSFENSATPQAAPAVQPRFRLAPDDRLDIEGAWDATDGVASWHMPTIWIPDYTKRIVIADDESNLKVVEVRGADDTDPGAVIPLAAVGPTGATGESAYQIAVDDGFVGTEAEWLASLVGATGPAEFHVETPSGTVNGTNTVFTLAETPGGDVLVFLDGTLQQDGVDYTISGDTITFTTAPSSGAVLTVAVSFNTAGPAGPAGESAYDVAVDNGFVGTEAEWLASLVGPPGSDLNVIVSGTGATVATAPSPATTGTSLDVDSGQGALFPAAPFYAVVYPVGEEPTSSNSEIVKVTAKATDTFTIDRIQDNTAARTILVGDAIALCIIASEVNDVETGLADHLADTSDAHDASAISIVDAGGYFTGTDVEAALQELGAGGGGGGGATDAADVTFTPAGTIAATDVQAAVEEVAADAAADLSAHETDATDAHDASAISVVDSGGYFTSSDVEGALQELGAAGGGGGGSDWTTVTKSADESVTSSTAMQNDDELFFSTVAGGIYYIEAFVIYTASNGGHIKIDVSEDATQRGVLQSFGWSTSDTPTSNNAFMSQQGTTVSFGGGNATSRCATIRGTVLGNGGTLRVRWAQVLSNATATVVKAGSVFRYQQIA